MKVVSVTVNFRTAELTVEAVEAVLIDLAQMDGTAGGETGGYTGGKVVVVDNDSGDGSYEHIVAAVEERGWGDRVEVIASPKNVGFGAGNNIAFRHVMNWGEPPEYIYLLNPDAKPDPGAVRALVEFMDTTPKAGMAGSRVRHPDGSPRVSAFRFPSVVSEIEAGAHLSCVTRWLEPWRVPADPPSQTCEVDWVSGASVMLRRTMLEEVGMFDEQFFLYFEETDLALRAQRMGWPTYYVIESEAVHIGQVSTGMKDKKKPRPRFWYESRAYYLRKNHGAMKLLVANTAFASAYAVYELRKRFTRKAEVDPPRFYRDFVSFNFLGRGPK